MTISSESDTPELANDDPANTVTRKLEAENRRTFKRNSIAARLDAENRRIAKKLHDAAFIHALYGALDGLSLSYSMVKYCFDIACADNLFSSNDRMHDWMLTPTGIGIAATESVIFIGFSLLGNVFKDDDKNAFKRYIAILWPYVRDTLKGLKNAYKGVRSTFQAISLLSGQDLNSMIVPVGIALGVLSVANRIWYRRMKEQRKTMQKANAALLKEIQKMDNIDEATCEAFRKRIQGQKDTVRGLALLSQAYSGVVDGLYLFMGGMGLAQLAPPVFTVLMVFSLIYAATCIVTRMYEEYDYQRRLIETQAKVELALCGKELERLFTKLKQLSKELATQTDEDAIAKATKEQQVVMKALEDKMAEFENKKSFLRSQVTLSYKSAALAGLKNGLAAYSALSSLMFAVATVHAMASVSFSPILLIVFVSAGMALLLGFLIYSLATNYQHLKKQKPQEIEPDTQLSILLKSLKAKQQEVRDLKPTKVKEAILDGMAVDPSPQFFFQEWFEVIRSFFSGLGKGQKTVDYTLNPLQEPDDQGHYHDSTIMLWVTAISSAIFALGLALRAYVRGFGQTPINKAPEKAPSPVEESKEVKERVLPKPDLKEDEAVRRLLQLKPPETQEADEVPCPKPDSPLKERPTFAQQLSHAQSPHTFFARTSAASPSTNPMMSPGIALGSA